MYKTMSFWIVVVVCVCILAGFLWVKDAQKDSLDELKATYDGNAARIANLENEQTQLTSTLSIAGTEAFIENQARTQYDYMMPDEIRFSIVGLEMDEESENTANLSEMPSP